VTLRVVVAVLLLIGVSTCGIASTLLTWRIIDDVNKHLPKERRFAPIGFWWVGKRMDLFAEYKRLYPTDRRRTQLYLLYGLAASLIAAAALVLASR
jgi:hypothetical protein